MSANQQPVEPLSKPKNNVERSTIRQTSASDSSLPPMPLSVNNGSFKPARLDATISESDEQPALPSPSVIVSVTTAPQPMRSPPRPMKAFRRLVSRVSSLTSSSMPRTPSIDEVQLFPTTAVATPSMSRREIAHIQLRALLDDPVDSLPRFVHGAGEMSLAEVSQKLNAQPFIIERLLKAISSMANSTNESITSENNVIRLTRALTSTLDVRTLLFFMMLDEDDDNHVTKDEMSQFLERYLQSTSFNANQLQQSVQILLQRFYLATRTQIDFEEFHSFVVEDPVILETFRKFTLHPTWFDQSTSSRPPLNRVQRFCCKFCSDGTLGDKHKSKLTPDYLHSHLSRVALITIYILVNLALFLYVVISRSAVSKSSAAVVFARIGGMLLNFNCSFIVVLVLKRTVLLIRSDRLLRKLIPVDSHIDYHKFVGRFIAVLSILHTIAHMVNFGQRKDYSWGTYMFTTTPGIGWVGGFTPLSGVILCVVLAIIAVCSIERIRRQGYFQVFYWSHNLYIVFLIFLIIHAKDFWKWAVGPLSVLLLEKLYSLITRYSSRKGRTHLNSVTIEQSDVISLNIHRPKNFTFRPGDYITINFPSVASYEFHPFTISSAPEERDILRVHIQACGNWTKRVYQRFKEMSDNPGSHGNHLTIDRADLNSRQHRNEDANYPGETNNVTRTTSENKETVIINGPYSSCARYIFDCEHVVLIAGGIGVTPYASILSSLMAQFRTSRRVCQHCHLVNYDRRVLAENQRLKQVDFIWVSRDAKSFEWFLKLLSQFEQEQEDYLRLNPNEPRFLTIHLYFTEMKNDEYVGNYPLELITQLWAQVNGGDIFTGLKSRTNMGRPVWNSIFTKLHSPQDTSNANNVDVFFCGPQVMGKAIKDSCTQQHFSFHEEKF